MTLVAQEKSKVNQISKITGRILDSVSSKPIEYASISVFTIGSNKPVTGGMSNARGVFQIDSVAPGAYRLTIDFIAYRSVEKNITISEKENVINLGKILLHTSAQTLADVTVTAQKGLIENKIDKIVFNAEKDLTSQGGVATDLLKKIPQVSVDIDGNVELAGSNAIRFLINGKPSTAFGNNIADVLQAIPASQIKAIEVITSPDAKQDAQGMGGIINIILKQSVAQGINGNVSLSAGTRTENGNINFNARKNNFGINLFVGGNVRLKARTPSTTDRNSVDTSNNSKQMLHQDGTYYFKRHGLQSGLGFDCDINKKNNLSGGVSYNRFGNNGDGDIEQFQAQYDKTGNLISSLTSSFLSNSKFDFHSVDANLTYKKKLAREKQELELGVVTSFGSNHASSGNAQFAQPQDSFYYGNKNFNPGTNHEIEFHADYTQPLAKDIELDFGGKIVLNDIHSSTDVYIAKSSGSDYVFDSTQANILHYGQQVYALYTQMSVPVKNWFDLKFGARYERTEVDATYSNSAGQSPSEGYNTIVPSIFIMRKLGENQQLRFSYSKRIERPDFRDLNPYVNTSDPKNVTTGNPYLKPEIANRFELSYNVDLQKGSSISITAFYRQNHDDIQPYVVYYPELKIGDSIYTNVAVSKSENIGTENNIGVSVFTNLHPTEKFEARVNFFTFFRHTYNQIDPGYATNSFNYRTNINLAYQFTKSLAAEFFGNFNSARNEFRENTHHLSPIVLLHENIFGTEKEVLRLQ